MAVERKVDLIICGPKSIVPGGVVPIRSRVWDTWEEVLNRQLELGLEIDQGVFVCTTNYTPTAPKPGRGWRADLNEQLSTLLQKYPHQRKSYTIRICHPRILEAFSSRRRSRQRPSTPLPFFAPNTDTNGANRRQTRGNPGNANYASQGHSFLVPMRPAPRSFRNSRESGHLMATSSAGASGGPLPSIKIEHINGDMNDDFSDVVSDVTSVSEEENELRRSGIDVEDIKSISTRRFSELSNAYMLRVRNELARLKERERNIWLKQFSRTPLAHHMLQEIFKL